MAPISWRNSSNGKKSPLQNPASECSEAFNSSSNYRNVQRDVELPGLSTGSLSSSTNSSASGSNSSRASSEVRHYRPRRYSRSAVGPSINNRVSSRLGRSQGSSSSKQEPLDRGEPPFETSPIALARREKQIDYGKSTEEYQAYLTQVPKEQRSAAHPRTPDKKKKYSRRNWDAQVKLWRLCLHAFNPKNVAAKVDVDAEMTEPDVAKEDNPSPEVSLYFCPMDVEAGSRDGSRDSSNSTTPQKSESPEN